MAPVSRVRGYVWRHGRQNPQSPRRALVWRILPVHSAGLARARVRMASWEAEPPQSPRRALVCLIIPVHGAGLARARVRMASWEAEPEPPISAPRARLPDYSRTMVPVARAYARVSDLETISPQSPRRALVCLIIPV